MEIEYTPSDLSCLEKILHDNGVDTVSYNKMVITELISLSKERMIESKDTSNLLKDWLRHVSISPVDLYVPPPERHEAIGIIVENFIFNTEIENVPLFVNDDSLKLYAKWRLFIGK